MDMKLVVIRHAHRHVTDSDYDNGLSEKGQKQAALLADQVRSGLLPHPHQLISSPKARARETLEPMAEQLNMEFSIDSNLDERSGHETSQMFFQRVKIFMDQWLQKESEKLNIFVCTHSDWIEEAVGEALHKGEYLILDANEGKWKKQR